MTKKYTAADFANARFAEHENGQLATRDTGDPDYPWGTTYDALHDRDMARDGWVPVLPARIIHDRDVEALCTDKASYERDDYLDGFIQGFQQAGGVILDDPKPTNTDNLTELMKEIDQAIGLGVAPRTVAKYLNDNGVTAPNAKGN